MLGLRTNKKNAQRAKQYLDKHALLAKRFKLIGKDSFIYLPIVPSTDGKKAKRLEGLLAGKLVEKEFEELGNQSGYKKELMRRLGDGYEAATKSYDLIGDMALIDGRGRVAKEIAKTIMATNKGVLTVISKGGAVRGKYRTRKYRHVLGKKNYIATYKENGAIFKFDIRKTFFSSRLAFDRLRIANLVNGNENVVVMFAGMGPFAIQIAKMHRGATVVGIELNRDACRYMKQNISLNHLQNVTAECGDVKRVAKKYMGFADRVIMPLPKDSHSFLGCALKVGKRRFMLHYYAFGKRETAFGENESIVRRFFSAHGRRVRIVGRRTVRQYSPKEIEIVLDVAVG
ncbi:MAG: class I SAM-dependent methyltransferase family protein [Candidatus Micrarchaeota archaeon]|nr:class I SAM-dependent methyltransferase family protein [Candidatus Micrarchaeota archaeon]MDE1864553.1 class I SAM-dependent methyltransferase family protein [Candidatus Micrarchaeota archaeon]